MELGSFGHRLVHEACRHIQRDATICGDGSGCHKSRVTETAHPGQRVQAYGVGVHRSDRVLPRLLTPDA
jgi:hypothetical protein